MAARAGCANTWRAERDRAGAELLIELRVEASGVDAARLARSAGRARQEEGDHVVQPVLDRAEARAVAPALADVERGLAVIALRRIGRAQVGQVVEPALFRAGADVEIDALDRFRGADRVLAALQNVVHRLGLLAALPALAGLVRLAPARRFAAGHSEALRHFRTLCGNIGRRAKLKIAFMVPGLDTVSIGSAEVSTVPGRVRAINCHSSRCCDMPEARICETRLY